MASGGTRRLGGGHPGAGNPLWTRCRGACNQLIGRHFCASRKAVVVVHILNFLLKKPQSPPTAGALERLSGHCPKRFIQREFFGVSLPPAT